MRGTILGLDNTTGEGVVADASGVRHSFAAVDWKSGGMPMVGQPVDYSISGDRAVDVYAVPGGAAATAGVGTSAGALSPQHQQAQTAGIIALISGVLSFPFFFIGWILAGVAMFYGIKAKNLGAGLPTGGPRMMGIAGIVLGAVSIVVSLGLWAMFGCSMLLSLGSQH